MTQHSSLIRDFLNPAFLPDKTKSVSLAQTHISMVFIGDEFVYKIKKPVNFGFLDFSTLHKRKYYCHKEVKLNQRLSQEIYLGVLPIVYDGAHYRMKEGKEGIVEYAVKMRRIPHEVLMKSLFERGELSNEHLKKISNRLVLFHSNALTSPKIDRFGQPERFKVNTDENFQQIKRYIGITIDEHDFKALKKWTKLFYETNKALFLKRISDGKVRDCHGDLHMEHICFTESLSIIDCIEFNDRFRYSDTVADMAFLLMDLEYHGGWRFAEVLWDYYQEEAREEDIESLVHFYKVYRAVVRGKVNSFQVDDNTIEPRKKEQAITSAKKYFQLACSYIN
ncbi:MAG: phosphotransferase [Pseudomonadota bacterium]